MTDLPTTSREESHSRTVYVPFALHVEPLARRVDRREFPLLDTKLKEGILRRYRELKAAGQPDIFRDSSGQGSYQYAGYLYTTADSAAAHSAIIEQLRPAFFLASIIDDSLHELFPRGIGRRRIEVGPPTSHFSVGRTYLEMLRQTVKPKDVGDLAADLFGERPPSALSLFLSVILVGLFALVHAWIQYRGPRAPQPDNAPVPPIVNSLTVAQDQQEREQPIIVRVPATAPVDPSAPKIIVIEERE